MSQNNYKITPRSSFKQLISTCNSHCCRFGAINVSRVKQKMMKLGSYGYYLLGTPIYVQGVPGYRKKPHYACLCAEQSCDIFTYLILYHVHVRHEFSMYSCLYVCHPFLEGWKLLYISSIDLICLLA